MRFYLDTEFNGHHGELISMALVSELFGGPVHKLEHFFYCCRQIKSVYVPWVREHVIPVLRAPLLSPMGFKNEFRRFINQFPDCEIVCDFHADAQHFCESLSGRDYESSLDFPCTIRILKTPPGVPISATPHNALDDARALRDWHQAQLLAA